MEWKALRDSVDKELRLKFVPELRSRGFKGSYPHFRRFRDDAIDILGIQFSQWAPQFYIEIAISPKGGITLSDGTHYPPKSVKHYHTGKRMRIGKVPFDYEHESSDRIAEQAVNSLNEGEQWWKANNPND
jgi:hypothetical protein